MGSEATSYAWKLIAPGHLFLSIINAVSLRQINDIQKTQKEPFKLVILLWHL